MGEKIQIKPCDLRLQRVVQQKEFELDMCENYLRVKMKFKAEEPPEEDEKLPWIEVDNDFELVFIKKKFAGIEKVWLQKDKRWKIIISIDGVGADLKIFFKRQAECEAVFNRLVYYFTT